MAPTTPTSITNPPGDAGGSDAPTSGTPVDPAAICGKVQHGAAGVEEVAEVGVSPAPTGGTIAPGRYVLFQVLSYVQDGGGPTGYFARKTLLFGEGNTFAFLESDGDTTNGVGQSTVTGGTYTVQQTNLVTKQVCPEESGSGQSYAFSASPGRVALRRGERWEVYQRK